MSDNVNHPQHYVSQGHFIEPIDLCRNLPFDIGNACKYIIRAGHKNNEIEDIKKAIWYLNDFVEKFNNYTFFRDPTNPDDLTFILAFLYYGYSNKYIKKIFASDKPENKRIHQGIYIDKVKEVIDMLKTDYHIEN